MTDHHTACGHRLRLGPARPAVLVGTAVLLVAGLLGADLASGLGPAGAIAVHVGPPPAGPPAGSAGLLATVVATERQITSLGAYSDAEAYLKVAGRDADAAHRAYGRSVRELGAAKAQEARAVAAEVAARRTVNLYYQALCELGIAEYTGIAVRDNLDLASQEREVEQTELGNVAATDTDGGWQTARGVLATNIKRVRHTRVVVAAAVTVVVHKKALLGTALAQLAGSRRALRLARAWVLVPGQAPARPVAALVSLEGKVALQVKRATLAALVRAIGPGTTTTTGTGTTTTGTGTDTSGTGTGTTFAAGAATTTGTTTSVTTTPTTTGTPTTSTTSSTTSTTTTTTTTTSTTTPTPTPTTPTPTTTMSATTTTAPAEGASAVAGEIRQAALSGLAADGPQILGTSVLSAAQIEAWFASTGAPANTTVPITTLVADYMEAGRLTGVRADLAFAQSVVETGYFSFPTGGQLTAKNNNFAGIGACDKCKHGWRFASAMDGVMAQEGLLSEYSGAPADPALFSIGAGGVAGCCTTWMSLAGVWATNPGYGFEILTVYKAMLGSALLAEEQQTGLVPPMPPALSGPPA